MRPVASSGDFAGVTYPEATGAQLPKKVTEKIEDPIFQNPSESLPPAKILLHGPANFAGPGVHAKTRPDRTRRGLCIVTGLRRHPARLYKPPRAGVRSPVEQRSGP